MTFIEYSKSLDTIKYLSEYKRTGSPKQLAEKLQVSERTIQRMIQQLRDAGFPVTYNRFRFTYELNSNSKKD